MHLRKIEISRGFLGFALLVAPRPMLRRVHRVGDDPKSVVVARVLGGRQLAQAVLSGVEPSPEVLAMGVWVDAAHAATALALAAVDPARAFAGFLNASSALVWAAWGYADVQSGPVTDPVHDRRRDLLARWALSILPGGGSLMRTARDRRRRAR